MSHQGPQHHLHTGRSIRFSVGSEHRLRAAISHFALNWKAVLFIGLSVAAAVIIILIATDKAPMFPKLDPEVSWIGILGIPVAVAALFKFHQDAVLGRSQFLAEFATALRCDPMLSDAFYYLVYNFGQVEYEKMVARSAARLKQSVKVAQAGKKQDIPNQEDLEVATEQPEGRRLYDPYNFTGSEEERRLDILLGYFDVIGYYYTCGLLRMRDIEGVLGYHLIMLSRKQPVRDYLSIIKVYWEGGNKALNIPAATLNSPYVVPRPYRHLQILLHDFEFYCEKHQTHACSINQTLP